MWKDMYRFLHIIGKFQMKAMVSSLNYLLRMLLKEIIGTLFSIC